MPKPSVALCSAKPMTSSVASAISSARRGLTDRQTLGEVVQADADRDQQRELTGGRPRREATPRWRVRRRGQRGPTRRSGGASTRRLAWGSWRPVHPPLVRDQREQTDREPAGEQRAVAERAPSPPSPAWKSVSAASIGSHAAESTSQTQEQQDADGDRVEHHPQRGRRPPHPPDRQAEQDRDAGDEAEQQRLLQAHADPPELRAT